MCEHDINLALPSTRLDWERQTCHNSNVDSIMSRSEAETTVTLPPDSPVSHTLVEQKERDAA